MKIQFYDLSASQELAFLNGKELSLGELYDHCQTSRPLWPALALDRDSFCAMEFHPYGADQGGWKSWARYFSTAVQLISGHVPSREEMNVVQGFVNKLPNSFKRTHVTHRFVLGFLPYLAMGFKGHAFESFVEESNANAALCEFAVSLCGARKVALSSFLCAHRDANDGENIGLLQSRIPPEKIRRSVGLVLGLAHNANEQLQGNLVLLQQNGSRFATSSIFPEVTAAYLESGRMYEMIGRLDQQVVLVRDAIEPLQDGRIVPRVQNLDVLSYRIERYIRSRFGEGWRGVDFTDYRFENDPLVEVAVNMALPDVERMMPFFSNDFQRTFIARKESLIEMNRVSAYREGGANLAERVTRTIEWFMLQHSMTISAKAVYETVFYYLWGKYCAKLGNVYAIGLDRDHARFQNFAWKLGAIEGCDGKQQHQSVPVYLRRNPNGRECGTLADLSFRQFWRY